MPTKVHLKYALKVATSAITTHEIPQRVIASNARNGRAFIPILPEQHWHVAPPKQQTQQQ